MCCGKVINLPAGHYLRGTPVQCNVEVQYEPVTRDEVGQYGEVFQSTRPGLQIEVCADGTVLAHVDLPYVIRHPQEEDILIPPGLYRVKQANNLRGGAPVGGVYAGE